MKTITTTKQQIREWEALTDLDNTGDELQAFTTFYLDENGESCSLDSAKKVSFSVYDYDGMHSFDALKKYLGEVGIDVDLTSLDLEIVTGDCDIYLENKVGNDERVQCREFSIILPIE